MSKFKVGDKVRITGDCSDFTDHLHGCIGVITEVRERDCLVEESDGTDWYIWNYNMELIDGD